MDLVEIEGLRQVVVGAASHRLDGRSGAAEGGDDDHRQVSKPRTQLGEHGKAVDAGHLEVEEDRVGDLILDGGQRGGAVLGLDDPIALGAEVRGEAEPDRTVVLGDQDLGRSLAHQRISRGGTFSMSAAGRRSVKVEPRPSRPGPA